MGPEAKSVPVRHFTTVPRKTTSQARGVKQIQTRGRQCHSAGQIATTGYRKWLFMKDVGPVVGLSRVNFSGAAVFIYNSHLCL